MTCLDEFMKFISVTIVSLNLSTQINGALHSLRYSWTEKTNSVVLETKTCPKKLPVAGLTCGPVCVCDVPVYYS